MGAAVKISRGLKQALTARAKSAAIDEANRSMAAAAVELQAQQEQTATFRAEVARLKAAAAVVPREYECPITMEIMHYPVQPAGSGWSHM